MKGEGAQGFAGRDHPFRTNSRSATGRLTAGAKARGVTTIGHVQDTNDRNTATGKIKRSMGEYFSASSNVGLFNKVTDVGSVRYVAEGKATKDNATALEANAIHEMAHGLIQPTGLANWIATMDFWVDRYTPSGKVDAESTGPC